MPGYGRPLIGVCLHNIHEDIVKCWNFREDEQDGKVIFEISSAVII
jgi:hypothetical protein